MRFSFGYMNTRITRLADEASLDGIKASFFEVQIHDRLKEVGIPPNGYKLPEPSGSYLTIHGEGETDGKHRIHLASLSDNQRSSYLRENLALYSAVIEAFEPWLTKRLVLHPDSIPRNEPRDQRIKLLARSLERIRDGTPESMDVCIEPRGGDRQGKLLRLELEDLEVLAACIDTPKRIGLCIDLAQLFITHGNAGMVNFLEELPRIGLPVKEIHASDVFSNNSTRNRVAQEIGKGGIDWSLAIPGVARICKEVLIETLGGRQVYERSRSFLEGLTNGEVLLPDSP